MDTREFLRRYAYIYLYVAAFFLGASALLRHSVETSGLIEPFAATPVIVIDAGHGGEDGGTTGASGTAEDEMNLAIARRLEVMLTLLGCQTRMTRTDSNSLATEGETIRSRKQSDLRNRVEMINSYPGAILVSIHQNHFPDPKYDGAQVFCTQNAGELARAMQTALREALSPKSRRTRSPQMYRVPFSWTTLRRKATRLIITEKISSSSTGWKRNILSTKAS